MEKLELLKEKIENIGFNPIWYADLDPESEEDQIFVKIGDAEFEINKSAAPEYFRIKRDTPFEEDEFFALTEEGVLDLLKGEEK